MRGFLSLLLFCSLTSAEPVILLTEHLPPYQVVQDDTVGGASTEIVTLAFKSAEIPYEIESYPWSIAYQRTLRDPAACLFSTSRIPQRETSLQWVGQVASVSTSFYGLSERNFDINTITNVLDYKVAALKDDVSHQYLLDKGFVEGQNLYVHHNYETLLALLFVPSRGIDLVILSDELLRHRLQSPVEQQRLRAVLDVPELTLYFYLACNLNLESRYIQSLSSAMTQLETAGRYKKIRQKWGISNDVKWQPVKKSAELQ